MSMRRKVEERRRVKEGGKEERREMVDGKTI